MYIYIHVFEINIYGLWLTKNIHCLFKSNSQQLYFILLFLKKNGLHYNEYIYDSFNLNNFQLHSLQKL